MFSLPTGLIDDGVKGSPYLDNIYIDLSLLTLGFER